MADPDMTDPNFRYRYKQIEREKLRKLSEKNNQPTRRPRRSQQNTAGNGQRMRQQSQSRSRTQPQPQFTQRQRQQLSQQRYRRAPQHVASHSTVPNQRPVQNYSNNTQETPSRSIERRGAVRSSVKQNPEQAEARQTQSARQEHQRRARARRHARTIAIRRHQAAQHKAAKQAHKKKYHTYNARMAKLDKTLLYQASRPLTSDEMGALRGYFSYIVRYKHVSDKSNEHSLKSRRDRLVYYYKKMFVHKKRNAHTFQSRFPKWLKPYSRWLLQVLSGQSEAVIDSESIARVIIQLVCLLDPSKSRRDMIADAFCNARPKSNRVVKQTYRKIQRSLDSNQLERRNDDSFKIMAQDVHTMLENQMNEVHRFKSVRLHKRERALTHDKLLAILIAQSRHESLQQLANDTAFWKEWGSSEADRLAYKLRRQTQAIDASSHKRIGTNITNSARKGR